MSAKTLTRPVQNLPALFDDFFTPWNEWFNNGIFRQKAMTMPAVNINEDQNNYMVSLAAPGLEKKDFHIDIEGNMLTISCEKEENKEEKDTRFTRKEYNYTSFSRSFTLPDEVIKDKIEAVYENGILKISLPKNETAKKLAAAKHITVK